MEDYLKQAIRQQARCSAVDAIQVARMLHDGYSDREVKAQLELDTAHFIVYKTWIANATEAA